MCQSPYITLLLAEIGERYADLRIVQPAADNAMQRSMQRYGQLTPVVVGREDDRYEMVDGFKRLRAGRRLRCQSLKARVMPGGRRAMKAAMIHLNSRARAIADIESAMVIRSLHREDHLSQVEIAALLDRHKSFVCRRLQLVEKLSAEVLEHLKLGLINISTGRELARLPAGNQDQALATILKYRLTGAQSAELASFLLQQPRWRHEAILRRPEPILDGRGARPREHWCQGFCDRLAKMELYLSTLTPGQLNTCERQYVVPVIEGLLLALAGIRGHFEQW